MQRLRWRLAWAILPAALLGGLTASGLAWAQQTPTNPPGATESAAPRVFFATSPTRILDTRTGVGVAGGQTGPLAAGSTLNLQVAGVGPVPANATGAAVNVTVFGTAQESFVTVWPFGTPRPGTSLLNPQPNLVLSQAASIGLGSGQLSIFNAAGSTHVVVDLVGYYQDTNDVPSLANVAHFLTGTTDPAPDLGAYGDVYINTTTNTFFGPKTANGWGTSIRLGGAMFNTGTTDPTPDQGALGDIYLNTATNTLFGPKTAAGWGTGNALGSHFSTGTTDPTPDQGVVGDIYLNSATDTLFGPKTAAGWGTGNALGAHFTTGTTDPTPAIGTIGDIYLNTATDTLFGPKTAAGWGTGAGLNPAVFISPASGVVPVTGTWSLIAGAAITLPPGKWLIQGKGNNNQSASSQVDVRIQNTTAGTTADLTSVYTPGAMRIGFSLGGAVNLTTTSTIQLQTSSVTAVGNVENARIWATQVSTINGA